MTFSPALRNLSLSAFYVWFSLSLAASPVAYSQKSSEKKPAAPQKPIAHFTDIAQKAGLTAPVIFGGENTKKFIIETTGTGVAIFDYDNDGWPDIFIVNGTTGSSLPPEKLWKHTMEKPLLSVKLSTRSPRSSRYSPKPTPAMLLPESRATGTSGY